VSESPIVQPHPAVVGYLERTAGKHLGSTTLLWMRDVLDVSGPIISSCSAFAERYRDRLYPQPMTGMVVLWNQGNGDIGLYVGHDKVIRMDHTGLPYIYELPQDPTNEEPGYAGAMWWPEEDG